MNKRQSRLFQLSINMGEYHPTNIEKVVYNHFVLLGSCTSQASVELLKAKGLEIKELEVVIVGHSEIVGKPIALHLLAQLAACTICHHGTRNLMTHTRRAGDLVYFDT